MARRIIILLLAAVAFAAFWASPASADTTGSTGTAAPPSSQAEQRTFRAETKPSNKLAQLELRNVKTGETVKPFATALAGPCDAPVSFSGVANYVNGVLSSVTLDFQAQVFCPPGGLNMGAIVVTAQMWKNTTMLAEGPTVNCVECIVSPVSLDFYACGGVGCAGSYWAANLHALRAPTGYVWTGAPPGCIGGLPSPPFEWIQCSSVTDIAVVTPNI